jgi:hypothetical protein
MVANTQIDVMIPASDVSSAPPDGLSEAALHYAGRLNIRQASDLAARLYLYNRFPLSARLRRSFPDAESVSAELMRHRPDIRRSLEQCWIEHYPAPGFGGWRMWASTRRRRPLSRVTHKLYVSPDLENTSVAFCELVTLLTGTAVPALKVAREVDYLVRPDKLIAYFDDPAEMREVAAELRKRLQGVTAQGVPFTPFLEPNGLLSWGMDPPNEIEATSWRGWLCRELARAMVTANTADPNERIQAALHHIRQQGVDTQSWEPTKRIWQQPSQDLEE